MYIYRINDLFRDNENVIVTPSQYGPGSSLSLHKHECIEIAYICSGSGYHIFNGEKLHVSEGDLFFIGRNSYHTYENETNNFSWINVLFLPSAVEKSIFDRTNADNVLQASFTTLMNNKTSSEIGSIALYNHKTEFDNIMTEMLAEYQAKHDDYQEILRYYLQILLIKIFRLQPKINPAVSTYSNVVVEYLRNRSLNNKIDMNAIARSAFLSPRAFRDMFKKATGKTLSAYITELRIVRAKNLLESTELPILTIMNEVGYNDSKFFYQLFERHTGMTPGDYRKNHTPTPDKPLP